MEFAIKQAEFVTSAGLGSPYPEKTAAEMDGEIRTIIDEAYAKAQAILTAYQPQLVTIAEYLLAHETMSGEAFEQVFADTPAEKI